MAVNIAARRAAKAQRRKAVVAQKRKAELQINSTAGQVRLAVANPIQHCLLSRGLFDNGMGTLVLARGATPYSVTAAVFLLDTFGLGVKDVFIRPLSDREFAAYVDRMSFVTPMVPVEPSYARKLLHDLAAWSHQQGFDPHPDYAKIEPLFGATDPSACDTEFDFGHDGKSVFISGLSGAAWDSLEPDDDEDFTIDDHPTGSADTESLSHAAEATAQRS
jgi:hypothetical protein